MDDELRRRLDETPTYLVLEYLSERFGLGNPGGRGRIEIEVDSQGQVQGVWRHERTSRGALGRFDPPPGSRSTLGSG